MYEIHKQTAAEDDLVAIWRYSFETWGADQADLYLDALNDGIAGLAENPHLGTDCRHIRQGYRRLHIRRHIVYYRLQSTRIEIVRVLHERMDPDRRFCQISGLAAGPQRIRRGGRRSGGLQKLCQDAKNAACA
jgi:toxin ParE1/3/4